MKIATMNLVSLNPIAILIGTLKFLIKRFKFASTTQQKANLIVLDPPYLQTMSNQPSTDAQVNTLAQINEGLSPNEACTEDNFTKRILESCLDASETHALFFIWCSLEQALQYLQIHKSRDLAEKGLTAVSHCMVNGKKRIMTSNDQVPSTTAEYFIVAKKGQPSQTTFDKWGKAYSSDYPHPTSFPNIFKVPTVWWDSISNQYPFEKHQTLMRQMVYHFARPGQLVFEGFAGTISCGLAALACGVNLVSVDNNPDTGVYLQGLYNQFNVALQLMEDADGEYQELEQRAESYLFVSQDMREWPKYELYCPADWVLNNVEVSNTEQSPFLAQNPIRTPNDPPQPSQSLIQARIPPPSQALTEASIPPQPSQSLSQGSDLFPSAQPTRPTTANKRLKLSNPESEDGQDHQREEDDQDDKDSFKSDEAMSQDY
jgi:16S rRNA G966 N2-methylase RsmD